MMTFRLLSGEKQDRRKDMEYVMIGYRAFLVFLGFAGAGTIFIGVFALVGAVLEKLERRFMDKKYRSGDKE